MRHVRCCFHFMPIPLVNDKCVLVSIEKLNPNKIDFMFHIRLKGVLCPTVYVTDRIFLKSNMEHKMWFIRLDLGLCFPKPICQLPKMATYIHLRISFNLTEVLCCTVPLI